MITTVVPIPCLHGDNWIHSSLENSASVLPNLVETLSSSNCTSWTSPDIFCCWSAWHIFRCWRRSIISCCCDLTKLKSSPSDDKILPSCRVQSCFRLHRGQFLKLFQWRKTFTKKLNDRWFQLDQCIVIRMKNSGHWRQLAFTEKWLLFKVLLSKFQSELHQCRVRLANSCLTHTL